MLFLILRAYSQSFFGMMRDRTAYYLICIERINLLHLILSPPSLFAIARFEDEERNWLIPVICNSGECCIRHMFSIKKLLSYENSLWSYLWETYYKDAIFICEKSFIVFVIIMLLYCINMFKKYNNFEVYEFENISQYLILLEASLTLR